MKTCFSIMPFSDGFRDIDRIIREAANSAGLKYVRGDLSKRPGSILTQIIKEIKHAAVVVADISGHNPNVFYELGIAHQILGPERVVLITQSVNEKQPYDVHQFRQLVYSHNEEGRTKLRDELPGRLLEAANTSDDHENWQVIRGRLVRTKMIVKDLKKLTKQADRKRCNGVVIRIVASLGSLAITDNEPLDAKGGSEYLHCLIEERDALRSALLRGALLKAVINPPRRFAQSSIPERVIMRYQRMIELLEGCRNMTGNEEDREVMKQCEFTLSPVPMPNLFIIDDTIAYEGMKRCGEGGFEMTHWETDKDELRQLIEGFDRFFEDSKRDMMHTHHPDGQIATQLRAFFEEARAMEKGHKQSNDIPA